MNKKREVYSDLLKIISIFIVIFIHAIGPYRYEYFGVNGKYYFFLTFIDSFTRIAVPLFFMITGTFMLSRKTDNYGQYLKQRLPKLLIPFIIMSVFYYFYECNKIGTSPNAIKFIIAFLNNDVKYHFWFMYVIIIIYLFIPFFQVLVQNLDRKKLLYLILLIIILANGFNTIHLLTNRYNHEILKPLFLPSIFSYMNYALMGYYFHKYKISKNKKILLFVFSIISICLIPIADHIFIESRINDEMLAATSIFPIIPSIFTYVLFKDFFEGKNINNKVNAVITKMSLCVIYIYMIHLYISEKFENDLKKIWTCNSFIEVVLRVIVVSIVTFIVSFIISYLILFVKNLIIKLKNKLYIRS